MIGDKKLPDDAPDIAIKLENQTLSAIMRECERRYLEHVLTQTGGNKTRAAQMAGVSLPTFREKVSRYAVRATFVLE